MSIEIKRWTDGAVLYTAEHAQDVRAAVREAVAKRAYLQGADLRGADLQRADLQGAYLRGAYLQRADLRGADLQRADLQGAYLQRADLQGAYLRGAYLQGADLRGAKDLNPFAVNDLLLLQHQVGKIRMYKVVTAEGYGPFNGGIKYEVGETYEVENANCDPEIQCAAGIHLATLPWCIREWSPGYRILLCEFTAKDVAAIPIGDGKFRVKRCKVVKEVDLAEIGLEAA